MDGAIAYFLTIRGNAESDAPFSQSLAIGGAVLSVYLS